MVSARSVSTGPKLSVCRVTTPSDGLNEKIKPEPGDVNGSWVSCVPIAVFRGEKLCNAELLKCAAWLNLAVESSGPPWSVPTSPPAPYTCGTVQIMSLENVGIVVVCVDVAVGHGPCPRQYMENNIRKTRARALVRNIRPSP